MSGLEKRSKGWMTATTQNKPPGVDKDTYIKVSKTIVTVVLVFLGRYTDHIPEDCWALISFLTSTAVQEHLSSLSHSFISGH